LLSNVEECQRVTRPQHFSDPAFVSAKDRQALGDLVGQTGPGGDFQSILMERPDHRHVGPQHAVRLIDDHPEEFGPVVRCREPAGDPEHRVQAVGKFGFKPAHPAQSGGKHRGSPWLDPWFRSGSLTADESAEDRAARRRRRLLHHGRPRRGIRRHGLPRNLVTRAHTRMVSCAPGRAEPPEVPDERGTFVPNRVPARV